MQQQQWQTHTSTLNVSSISYYSFSRPTDQTGLVRAGPARGPRGLMTRYVSILSCNFSGHSSKAELRQS
eukprot:10777710-Alexandrium_andersonii.AAC.1